MKDTLELTKLCITDKHIRRMFVGVFASDMLPKNISYPAAMIANTKPSTHPGQHWIAIFVNKEGYGDYFCSYGQLPDPEFVKWMERECLDWNSSTKQLQHCFATTCGQYAAFFLHCRARGASMSKILNLFTKNEKENDKIVAAFIDGLS